MKMKGCDPILKHGEILEKGVHLKSSTCLWLRNDQRFLAGNILFVENDLFRGWRHDAGHQIEKGRFAGVIGTDQTDDLSREKASPARKSGEEVRDGRQATRIIRQFFAFKKNQGQLCFHHVSWSMS